jgi:hypothetical protein
MRELACSVLLVHHTGVSDEAQHRARGSSAWRGALDIEISVVPGKEGQPLQIVSRKTKDAEPPETVYAELRQLEIAGWVDEDGEPVTSCVIEIADAPAKRPPPNPHYDTLKILERAFFASKAERVEFYPGGLEVPYITTSAMRNFLEVNLQWSGRKIENAMDTTNVTSLLGALMDAEQIAPFKDGFVVLADDQTSAWLTA